MEGGVSVAVRRAPGWKCERCRKVLPEVGLCEAYPDLCLRCRHVVRVEHDGLDPDDFDVYEAAARRFDRFLVAALADGLSKRDAVLRAGRLNAGELET